MTNKQVQLRVYIHDNTETTIEEFHAKDWGDFLVVGIKADNLNQQMYEEMALILREYAKKMDREVILVPSDWDIQFYGIEVYDEKRSDELDSVGENPS